MELIENVALNSTLTTSDIQFMIPDYYSGIDENATNDDLKG
jgi:hypothetical protein